MIPWQPELLRTQGVGADLLFRGVTKKALTTLRVNHTAEAFLGKPSPQFQDCICLEAARAAGKQQLKHLDSVLRVGGHWGQQKAQECRECLSSCRHTGLFHSGSVRKIHSAVFSDSPL